MGKSAKSTYEFTEKTAYIPFYRRYIIPSLPSGYSIHVLLSEIQYTFPSIIGTTYLPSIGVFHTCASIRDTAYIPFYHRYNIPSFPSGLSIYVLLSEIQHTFPSIIGTICLPLPSGNSIHVLLSEIQHTFPSIIGTTYLPFHQGIPYMSFYHRYSMHPFYHRYNIPFHQGIPYMLFYQRYIIDGQGTRAAIPLRLSEARALGLISQTEEGYKA
jgi:hypothetical protein